MEEVQALIESCSAYGMMLMTEANYDLQHRNHHLHPPLRLLHDTLNHAGENIFPCLRMLLSGSSLSRPFGFLFIYGLHGGENLGELMESICRFTSRLGESMKGCKVIMTELGLGDSLINFVPRNASLSCIDDLWCIKRLSGHSDQNDELLMKGEIGNVFVDPREF
ncbi:probable N-acetyltransferase HLS1 [Prosopis cineraria]|uniref:probable N-acetyltransferase HLS1 n=1 Tax=Prosopis cineraria TaxID=364024 RepID=UPI00240F266B|nr:probable N-acetyltransferase HLS1 [Prosopis cineraria]